MKTCCEIVTLEVGHVCPLCGTIAADTLPEAAAPVVAVTTVARSHTLRIGHPVQARFRFGDRSGTHAAAMAERKARGWTKRRPGKKRAATQGTGPLGRARRKAMLATG